MNEYHEITFAPSRVSDIMMGIDDVPEIARVRNVYHQADSDLVVVQFYSAEQLKAPEGEREFHEIGFSSRRVSDVIAEASGAAHIRDVFYDADDGLIVFQFWTAEQMKALENSP